MGVDKAATCSLLESGKLTPQETGDLRGILTGSLRGCRVVIIRGRDVTCHVPLPRIGVPLPVQESNHDSCRLMGPLRPIRQSPSPVAVQIREQLGDGVVICGPRHVRQMRPTSSGNGTAGGYV